MLKNWRNKGKMDITILQCEECGSHSFGAAIEEENYEKYIVLTCNDCGGSFKYQTLGDQL